MQPPFKSLAVANRFIQLAGESGQALTLMALLKLVYFAHGWYLGLTGKPLLDEQVEAWKFGPVAPSVYHAFKQHGSGPITGLGSELDEEALRTGSFDFTTPIMPDDPPFGPFMRRVWEIYGKFTPFQLSDLTHQAGSPWDTVWNQRGGKDRKGTDIPDEVISDYFKRKVNKSNG